MAFSKNVESWELSFPYHFDNRIYVSISLPTDSPD